MPNRPIGFQLVADTSPSAQDQVLKISAEEFLGGLITDDDPANIPLNSLAGMLNGTYTRKLLVRRNGLAVYGLAKPNSLRIMAVFAFFETATGINLLRFTTTTIHKATGAGWVAFGGPALIGTSTDYFSFTVADNRLFFSNGAQNVIMELLPATNTWAVLGNAPKYKFIAASFNRIVGANIIAGTSKPYQVGWSGDLNYSQWDPLVDVSAGNTPLVDSPSDLSDDITGLVSLSTTLCIPRQRSLWLATKLPSATQPFNFYVSVPRIGADTPRTIKLASEGIFFYCHAKSAVYFYAPGPYGTDQPVEISSSIKRYLKSLIDDPANVYAAYNPDTSIYSIFIASNTDQTSRVFSFNQNTKNWAYEEYSNIVYINDLDYGSSSVNINGLTGTINALLGTINGLGGLVSNSNRFVGYNNGDLVTQPVYSALPSQVGNIVLTDNGVAFSSQYDSKTIEVPIEDIYVTKCRIGYKPFTTGNVSLYYSKDDGTTFTLYKTVVVTAAMVNKNQIITGNKFIKTRRFIWRFLTSDCMHSLNRFDIATDKEQNEQGPISRR